MHNLDTLFKVTENQYKTEWLIPERKCYTFKKHEIFHEVNHLLISVKKNIQFYDRCAGGNALRLTIAYIPNALFKVTKH